MASGEEEGVEPSLKSLVGDHSDLQSGDESHKASFLIRSFEERYAPKKSEQSPERSWNRKPGGTQSVPSYGLHQYSAADENDRLDHLAAKELQSIIDSVSNLPEGITPQNTPEPECTVTTRTVTDPDDGTIYSECCVYSVDGPNTCTSITRVTTSDDFEDEHVVHTQTVEKHIISHEEKEAVVDDVINHIVRESTVDEFQSSSYAYDTLAVESVNIEKNGTDYNIRAIQPGKLDSVPINPLPLTLTPVVDVKPVAGYDSPKVQEAISKESTVLNAAIPSLVLLPVDPDAEVLDWWFLVSSTEPRTKNRVVLHFEPEYLKITYKFLNMPAIKIPIREVVVEIPKSRKLWRRLSQRRMFLCQGLAKLELVASLKCDRDRFVSRLANASPDSFPFLK